MTRKQQFQEEPTRRNDDLAVTSEPVEMEDGRSFRIQQQNVGPANQAGGGEFKNVGHRRPEDAALEQLELEKDAPIEDSNDDS
jgi:hypothetical protein